MKKRSLIWFLAAMVMLIFSGFVFSEKFCITSDHIYRVGVLKPIDSRTSLKVGDEAPDFSLSSITGERIALSQFRGKKNVVLSFVPAAWTPVCSNQWPAYNISEVFFNDTDTVLIGITVDNIPTLYAWTKEMGGVWFVVLSDFWPHGAVSAKYGVLRSSGTSERALFVIDKKGIIRYMDIHDINEMPKLEVLAGQLKRISTPKT